MKTVDNVQLTDMREDDTLTKHRTRYREGKWKVWVAWCIEHDDGILEVAKRQPICFN